MSMFSPSFLSRALFANRAIPLTTPTSAAAASSTFLNHLTTTSTKTTATIQQPLQATRSLSTKAKKPSRILVTGCLGQIGSELLLELRERGHYVVGTDVRKPNSALEPTLSPFLYADVTERQQLASIIVDHRIDWLVHNAALLSGAGEMNPQNAIHLNINGLHNALELARIYNLRLFVPSSIAAFGPTTPLDLVGDITIQRPTTVYGISKVYAEHLGEYYQKKYNVDFRSIRYPGIISSKTLPGFGTTDYAVEIFYHAVKHYTLSDDPSPPPFKCFLAPDTRLPMMYMPDCLRATIRLLEADESELKQRTYNVSAMSFTPTEIAEAVKLFFPNFQVLYQPDFRQAIANGWPKRLDDSAARKDWGWKELYDLNKMSADMISQLTRSLTQEHFLKSQH